MTKIKICGLTRKEDLLFAASAEADAVGIVNVSGSKRYVSLEEAEKLFSHTPLFVSKVLVATPKDLEEAEKMAALGIDYIQLHGDQDIGYVKELRDNLSVGLIKQVAVKGRETIEECMHYSDYVDALLLDTETKGSLGGTGVVHDWEISKEVVEKTRKPVILAGGLNPGNVAEAIKKVGPYAVDVASGIESGPGIKDNEKIIEFIKKVRSL